MNTREKVLLCAAPYLVAGYLWFSLTSPIFTEGATQDNELNQKRREQGDLKSKLDDLTRLETEHKDLEEKIQVLRSSVPKAADLDLMVIDLEKMAQESGLDMIAVSPPSKDELKEEEEGEEDEPKSGPPSGPPGSAPGLPAAGSSTSKSQPSGPLKSKDEQVAETGLKSELVQVKLSGDYPSYVNFMRKFDAYQRVVDINRVEVKIPTGSGEEKKAPDPKHLDISFRITAYYLP